MRYHRLTTFAATLFMLPLAAVAQPVSRAFPAATGTTLRAVFDKPASRPGVRLMELTRTASGWTGRLVSDWYGTMPMSRIVHSA